LESLNTGLRPFVERELQATYGKDWVAQAGLLDPRAPVNKREPRMDAHALLGVMWDQWNDVFKKTLGQAERTLVRELRDVRNKWAHQEAFSTDDAYRSLDCIQRLPNAVSAPESPRWTARSRKSFASVLTSRRGRKSAAPENVVRTLTENCRTLRFKDHGFEES
jgi:hypothetical protein